MIFNIIKYLNLFHKCYQKINEIIIYFDMDIITFILNHFMLFQLFVLNSTNLFQINFNFFDINFTYFKYFQIKIIIIQLSYHLFIFIAPPQFYHCVMNTKMNIQNIVIYCIIYNKILFVVIHNHK